MKNKREGHSHRVAGGGILLSSLCLGLLAFGQSRDTNSPTTAAGPPDYDLSWFTVDGGGVMFSTGGDLELSGTIGQPDAAVVAGGDFTLTGGFWFRLVAGDCNSDGGVNLLDYDVFEACLSGPDGGLTSPGCACFDLDGDNDVDLGDVARFQQTFTGG